MPASIFGNPAAVVQLNQALFGIAPGNGKYTNQLDQANAVGAIPFARQLGQTVAATNEALAATVLANVGIVNATLQTALVQAFAAFPNDRGVVVLNLTNILTTLEGNAVYGAAATQFNSQVATNFQYSTNSVNTADSAVNAGTFTLTANTDVLSGNVFEAGLVFTPGGDDRINSLQDEDRLTGTGTNATLNATLGNANDNGGVVITPTLNNIATINAAFTGAAAGGQQNGPVNILDLQDATGLTVVNTTRASSGLGATGFTYANMGSAATNSFGISGVAVKTNANFDFQEGVLANPGQSATFRLNAVQLAQLNAHNNAGGAAGAVTSEGFENVTINSTGSNQIDRLTVAQMRNLTLEGAGPLGINNFAANAIVPGVTTLGTTTEVGAAEFQAFTPGAIFNVNAPLETINGTTATGALSIDITGFEGIQTDPANSGRTVFLNFQGGTAADRVIHGNAIGDVSVTINGGAGNDTLSSYASVIDLNPVNATNPVITSIENLEVRAQGANTAINIDLSEIGGLTNTLLRNETSAVGPVVFGLLEATQDQANNISINHGATRGNFINQGGNDGTTVRVNLNDASGANDTVAIRLVTDQNNNVRFNFALDADGNQVADQFAAVGGAAAFGNDNTRTGAPVLDANNQPIRARVENITINDTDAESNAIELTRAQSQVLDMNAANFRENADNHRGTITVTGGQAGQFMNLDATANAYRWDQSGANNDGGTGSPTITAINGRPTNGSRSDIGGATAERLVAGVIDTSAYLGDLVLRVSDNLAAGSLGGQRITFGAGNDTVLFDQVSQVALNRNTAGLTISDTVSGGAGTDILALDGHAFAVTITASEWTNVSGFEVIRTVGNAVASNNARGATNAYNLTLTNDLLNTNGAADGGVKRVIIVNDNDATNDRPDTANDTGNAGQGAAGNIAVPTGVETGITIDARTLNANNSFEYRGEEGRALTQAAYNLGGAGDTADRFILADANINGAAIIDGGAGSNITTVTNGTNTDSVRNNDVLEVRNSATVSAGDLANISNVGTIEFTNDTSTFQNSILVVDDSIIDRMVDAYQASRAANGGLQVPISLNQERLVVKGIDNLLVNGATTGLTIQADSLTTRSALDVFLGRGTNNVVTGNGDDVVVLLGNYNAGVYAAANEFGEAINTYANNVGGQRMLTPQNTQINLGGGTDTIRTYGGINFAGLAITPATFAGVENVQAFSDITLSESQFRSLTNLSFLGNVAHTLTITAEAGSNGVIDLSKITVNGAAQLTITNNSGDTVSNNPVLQNGGTVVIAAGGAISVTVAQALASDFTANQPTTVLDTGANIAAGLTNGTLAANDGIQPNEVDFFDANDNILTTTVAGINVARNARLTATDVVTVQDVQANFNPLSFADLSALTNVDFFRVAGTGTLNLSVNQALAIGNTRLVAENDVVIVDAGNTIANNAVGNPNIAFANIDRYDAMDNVLTVTVAQVTALTNAKLTGAAFAGADDLVTVNDSGANIAALTAAQITALTNVDKFDATPNVGLTVSVAQAAAITGARFTDADVVTVSDTGATLAANVGGLGSNVNVGGANINNGDRLDATDNAVTLTAAQFAGLAGAASAKFVDGDTLSFAATIGADVVTISTAHATAAGVDRVLYTAGNQATVATFTDVADNTQLATNDRFTFVNNTVDVYTGFASGTDKLNLAAFNLFGTPAVATQFTTTGTTVANGQFAIVRGGYNAGTGVFTADAGGVSSLVVWDADTSAAVSQVAIVLTGTAAVAADLILA